MWLFLSDERVLDGKFEEKIHVDLGVGWKITLKWILKK
jgi:hypothetical protein